MAYGATKPEEDFRSRYAAETAGMPVGLAAIASRNLAAEDASLAKVNAAGRLNPLPVVGGVGSTPETDATNLSTAAAMERGDLGNRFGFGSPQYQQGTETPAPTLADTHTDDIMARRDQIDGQKKQIMAKLGVIPPSEAGFSAVVLADPKERVRLLQDWHVLETENQNLLGEHQQSSVFNARQAHENLAREEHIRASSGIAKILNGITEIGRQHPKGTPEHDQAVLNLLGSNDPEIAAARGTDSFDKLLKPYAEQSDRAALSATRIKEALNNYKAATGNDPGSVEITATGGVNIRGKSTANDVPDSILRDYTALKVDRASQQAYLDKETDPKLKPALQKKIDILDAQLGAVHEQFPSLATKAVVPAVLSPEDIRTQYKAGKLTKEKATELLKKGHGFE